jgi:ATP phosphoribosyltransferase
MKANGIVRIAIQKSGRMTEGSVALLRQMGLQFEAHRDHLFAPCRNLPIDILFLRDDDIPEYVQDGVADLGIVGSNILDERSLQIERLLPLDFGYCELSIAVSEQEPYQAVKDLDGRRIATSYPRMLRGHLESKQVTAHIVMLKGCVESAPALGVADAICDLVATGSTLRTNRLRVIDTVSECQAMLISRVGPAEEKRAWIEKLQLRARGVEEARKYKYVMFNAPQSALQAIKRVMPSCKSPTVIGLAQPGYVAVHAMVLEEMFWDLVDEIRACGGTDIIVSGVEKFIR